MDGTFSVSSKKLGPKFWTLSKMLQYCSYLVCENNSWKEFITPNMSKIGAFLTMSKIYNPILLKIRKKSRLNFWYVAINRQIYLFQATYRKFRGDFFRIVKKIGSKILDIVKNAPILLIFGVWKRLKKRIHHTKYEQNWSMFDNVKNFGPYFFDDTEKVPSKFLICCFK